MILTLIATRWFGPVISDGSLNVRRLWQESQGSLVRFIALRPIAHLSSTTVRNNLPPSNFHLYTPYAKHFMADGVIGKGQSVSGDRIRANIFPSGGGVKYSENTLAEI